MLNFIYIIALGLGLAAVGLPELKAQEPTPVTQLQQAVHTRIENLVRTSANDFYEKSHLPPPELKQVAAMADIVEGPNGAVISSMDLKIEIVSEDPPEVIRQLRQYISQVLSREGFSVDQESGDNEGATQLSLTLAVVTPQSSVLDLNFKERWPDYLRFGLIILAFLSSLVFLGYLFLLPASWRRRRRKMLHDAAKKPALERSPEVELPPLPSFEPDHPTGRTTLRELHALDDQHIEKFPVWVDPSGARMSDIEGVRKAFEVLPFEEALDMLTCMEEGERNLILNQLNLNPSVKARIKKALENREPTTGQPVLNN